MQRKKVTIYLQQNGTGQWEPVEVEARCKVCKCFDLAESSPGCRQAREGSGKCYLKNTTVRKHKNDWCWDFKPEIPK